MHVPSKRDVKRRGALTAAAIAFGWTVVPVVAGFLFGDVAGGLGAAALLLAPSIPVGLIFGWSLAPWVVSSRSLHRPALTSGLVAVITGAPLVALLLAAINAGSLTDMVIIWFWATAVGILAYGWLYLVVTIPSGYLWAWLLRRWARRRPSSGPPAPAA